MLSDAKAVSSSLTLISQSFAVSTAQLVDVGRRLHFCTCPPLVLVVFTDSFNDLTYRFKVHVLEACVNKVRHVRHLVGVWSVEVWSPTQKTQRIELARRKDNSGGFMEIGRKGQ
ncbi:hypothetical protein LX36DRAFT_374957 [Colletotrichum falcatum]|nr:hypothetical protein LX36DRAFT_374957 [Colletotrichum falcatum]